MSTKKRLAKKRNPQDATLRNTRAARSRYDELNARVMRLEHLLGVRGGRKGRP